MKSITPRRQSTGLERRGVDPFEMMREMLNWEPFTGTPMGLRTSGISWSPSFEVKETKDGFVFKADVPGLKEEDLDISLTGNRLVVSGKREEEKEDEGEQYYTYERSYGSFSRAFTLPDGVDGEHVQAELKDGVLTLHLPKVPEVQPKKISLSTGKGAKA